MKKRIISVFLLGLMITYSPLTLANATEKVAEAAKEIVEAIEQVDESPVFNEMWDKITPVLDDILQREKQQPTLPKNKWFGEDQTSNLDAINQLLDEAVEILAVSDTKRIRQQLYDLDAKINAAKAQIAQYHQMKISAPVESTWKTTAEQYDHKIAHLEEQILYYEEQAHELKIAFADSLTKMGLILTSEQIDLLLISVVGDDIVQTSIVYNNVKLISQKLMELTVNTGEDFAISQRYYGMYNVLLKILLHMESNFINDIDTVYLPKIVDIEAEIKTLSETTHKLITTNKSEYRYTYLVANLEAQKLTAETAALYRKHLLSQKNKMLVELNETKAHLAIAENTYQTVIVSGKLVDLLRTSQKSFDLLLSMQVPELLVFKNLQMQKEFENLTAKLQQM